MTRPFWATCHSGPKKQCTISVHSAPGAGAGGRGWGARLQRRAPRRPRLAVTHSHTSPGSHPAACSGPPGVSTALPTRASGVPLSSPHACRQRHAAHCAWRGAQTQALMVLAMCPGRTGARGGTNQAMCPASLRQEAASCPVQRPLWAALLRCPAGPRQMQPHLWAVTQQQQPLLDPSPFLCCALRQHW